MGFPFAIKMAEQNRKRSIRAQLSAFEEIEDKDRHAKYGRCLGYIKETFDRTRCQDVSVL
jgi:hypothetical protein